MSAGAADTAITALSLSPTSDAALPHPPSSPFLRLPHALLVLVPQYLGLGDKLPQWRRLGREVAAVLQDPASFVFDCLAFSREVLLRWRASATKRHLAAHMGTIIMQDNSPSTLDTEVPLLVFSPSSPYPTPPPVFFAGTRRLLVDNLKPQDLHHVLERVAGWIDGGSSRCGCT